MQFTSDDMSVKEWYYENLYKWCRETRRNHPFVKLWTTKISKRFAFVLDTWSWRLPEEWPEACGSITVVGAGTMPGFGIHPIRNPTIWLAESGNQVNQFAYRGRIRCYCWGISANIGHAGSNIKHNHQEYSHGIFVEFTSLFSLSKSVSKCETICLIQPFHYVTGCVAGHLWTNRCWCSIGELDSSCPQ